MRTAEIKRKTKETDISLKLTLEGGERKIDTGIGFFDHMLNVCFGIRSEIFVRVVKTDDLVVACRCKMICGFFRFHCFLCTGKRA